MSVRVPPRRPGGPTSPTGGAASTTSSAPAVETRPPAGPEALPASPGRPERPTSATSTAVTSITRADARATHGADIRARATEARLAGATPTGSAGPTPDTSLDAARARAATARDRAGAMDYEFVNWGDRETVLNQMTQFDAAEGGRDSTRCGAATLTGGLVLAGPEAVGDGRERVLERIGTLRERAGAMTDPALRTEANRLLDDAETHLATLQRRDPEDWRYGDLGEFQEGLAATMAADRYISSGGTDTSSGVRESSVAQYRDLLWEGHQPTYLGEPVDVVALTPAAAVVCPGTPCWAWEAPNAAWSSMIRGRREMARPA